ncbi:hypothetical protein [Thermoflexibacter ruber]|uniref:hypothetical protein n=1 Tax=Thermoflexibacter ruber TaxID=1003 RepID=UPI0015A6EB8C|nr:hypothetical protein [Thermoflexibacter ruber]
MNKTAQRWHISRLRPCCRWVGLTLFYQDDSPTGLKLDVVLFIGKSVREPKSLS